MVAPVSDASVTRGGVVRSGAWVLTARVISAATGLVLYALLARVVPQRDVGTFFSLRTLAMFIAGVAALGMGKVIVRFVGEVDGGHAGDRRGIIRRGASIAAIGGIIAAGGVALLRSLDFTTGQVWTDYALVFAVLLLVGAPRMVLPEGLRALADLRGASLIGGTMPKVALAVFLAVAWLVGRTMSAESLLWFTALTWLAVIVIVAWMLDRRLPRPSSGPIPSYRTFLAVGVPWLSTLIGSFATMQFGVVAVAAIEGADEAAVYGAAWTLAQWVAVPHAIVVATIQPYIVRLSASGQMMRLERLMRKASTVAGALALVGFVGLVVLGSWILGWLFGPAYSEGYGVLVILSLGHVFSIVSGVTIVALSLTGHQNKVMVLSLVIAPVTMLAVGGMTELYGAIGAALASTVGLVALNLAGAVLVKRYMGVRAWMEPSLSVVDDLRDVVSGGVDDDRSGGRS